MTFLNDKGQPSREGLNFGHPDAPILLTCLSYRLNHSGTLTLHTTHPVESENTNRI